MTVVVVVLLCTVLGLVMLTNMHEQRTTGHISKDVIFIYEDQLGIAQHISQIPQPNARYLYHYGKTKCRDYLTPRASPNRSQEDKFFIRKNNPSLSESTLHFTV